MKASEALRLALADHYGFCGDGLPKSEFMCHALEDLSTENPNIKGLWNAVQDAKSLIGLEIGGGWKVLVSYLVEVDAGYMQAIGPEKDHDTQRAYNYRVKWWLDFIARLEADGN